MFSGTLGAKESEPNCLETQMRSARSLLTGAAMVFLAAACSEMATAPSGVAPTKAMMEAPVFGPSFVVNPGSLELGMTPPGGVTSAGSGSAADPGGGMIMYSDIKSGNFAFLGWAPGQVGLALNGFGAMPLFYEGMTGGGEDEVVAGAVWSGSVSGMANGEPYNIPVRVVFNASVFQAATTLDSAGLPSTVGAFAVVTLPSTTLTVHVAGEAFYQGLWQPMSIAFASLGQAIGQTLSPSVMVQGGWIWRIKSCDAGNYMDTNAGGCQQAPAGSYSLGGYAI